MMKRKVMGGGVGEKPKIIRARENVPKKIDAKKIPKKNIHTLDGLH